MSIFLGFSAANTSNNLIYLIAAAMLGFMGVSGIFGKRNLSKIEVAIEAPNEVFAGVEFPMKITLTNNRGFLPGFLLDVAAESTGVLFPFVQTKTSQFRHVPFTFPTRGTQSIRAIYVCSVFPFNFFIRCTKIQPSKEFLVYPAPKKCTLPGAYERNTHSQGERPSDKSGYDSDIVSIRNYIHGDPLKYISWKATARSGKLKTKELSSMSSEPVLIDFDKTGIADKEERISCITYAVLSMLKRNIPVGLKINDMTITPGVSYSCRAALLNALALLPPNDQ